MVVLVRKSCLRQGPMLRGKSQEKRKCQEVGERTELCPKGKICKEQLSPACERFLHSWGPWSVAITRREIGRGKFGGEGTLRLFETSSGSPGWAIEAQGKRGGIKRFTKKRWGKRRGNWIYWREGTKFGQGSRGGEGRKLKQNQTAPNKSKKPAGDTQRAPINPEKKRGEKYSEGEIA